LAVAALGDAGEAGAARRRATTRRKRVACVAPCRPRWTAGHRLAVLRAVRAEARPARERSRRGRTSGAALVDVLAGHAGHARIRIDLTVAAADPIDVRGASLGARGAHRRREPRTAAVVLPVAVLRRRASHRAA